ncbi:AAA family ATPase [uncultured Zhongshania sp.]|uniref:AAA family ATPase n=1 Tax=uncultured Zhongshania sp. TaxID=1642288 RepID=UPI0030D7C4F3|tara:strand:+ start:383 stop:1852 length:1470 start_codon:yes stop_codon:yes gene_type:complete
MNDSHDLRLIIESRIPVIVIETWEEKRALTLLSKLGIQLGLPVFAWSITEGLRRSDYDQAANQPLTAEPEAALKHIRSGKLAGIYTLCDIHPFLNDEPRIIRLIKDIALDAEETGQTLILVSHAIDIPSEFKRHSARFNLSMPEDHKLRAAVYKEAQEFSASKGRKVKTDRDALDKLINNLRGLPLEDARKLARGAIFQDGAITHSDIAAVNKAKFELLDMDGVLSFEYDTADFAHVGGLSKLKDWLSKREQAFTRHGDDAPKGIMLVGVQGGGKSLAAKAVAGLWGLPLLRMDMGALYNKFFGESERNVREALALAETMSPCVLWIDEIEKGIGSDTHDGGTSRRILATLLTWMAEHKQAVFVVATANDIQRLPPELIRKGRLDEIFFVDLPSEKVRQDIFAIHLKKRNFALQDFRCAELSAASDGFTGAEIEQAIVAARYSANARNENLTTAHILHEISSTVPLAITMSENIDALRHWCQSRAVASD